MITNHIPNFHSTGLTVRMLKNLNLLSLTQAYQSLSAERFTKFLSYHNIELKAGEIGDLCNFVALATMHGSNMPDLNSFFVGYKIPQIGKEFDLLKFGGNFHINIELKSTSTEEKILKQLIRNRYYLKLFPEPFYHITFRADTNTLYLLQSDNSLAVIDWGYLINVLRQQQAQDVENADNLFDPSNYLVSPFNSTDLFLNGEYFLTNQQEDIKTQIINSANTSTGANFVSLTGSAGTGKTLLAYDIVKTLHENGKPSLIAHCGQLNAGQQALIAAGWPIIPIKNLKNKNFENFHLILIDEAQRLYKSQIDFIYEKITEINGNCIFSYDKMQTLATHEEVVNASGKISAICERNSHSLSEKIRTNKEIANFIKSLLDVSRNFEKSRNNNITVRYFSTSNDVRMFLSALDPEKWQVLRFTPSQHQNEFHEQYSQVGHLTSHKVIGQEFEGVAVVIDQFFSYNNEGKLIYQGGTYYSAAKMLFQNLTRARKRLLVVVLQNETLLDRCMSIT